MAELYHFSVYLILGFAALVFVILFFVPAPYGKFVREGWGKTVSAKWAWMLMELPSPLLMTFFFLTSYQKGLPQYFFIVFWLLHYLHRAFLYPFTQSGRDKPYPLVIVGMAFTFNCLNGFVNGYGLFQYAVYSFSWIMVWQFPAGMVVFITGFILNKIADAKFRSLRKADPGEYSMPQRWLFNYISCPHYLGEIIEWTGWAIMTWSLPGTAFAVFTFANLFPRAITSHKWYKSYFPDYPKKRKALIPFII